MLEDIFYPIHSEILSVIKRYGTSYSAMSSEFFRMYNECLSSQHKTTHSTLKRSFMS